MRQWKLDSPGDYLSFVLLWIMVASPAAFGVCAPRNSQLARTLDLTEKAALVTKENRRSRRQTDIGKHEGAQGRVWCFSEKNPNRLKSWHSSKNLETVVDSVSNGSLFFEGDVAVVNRHLFKDAEGNEVYKPENCYFEHIQSGKLIRGTRLVKYNFSPIRERADVVRSDSDDLALWRLSQVVDEATPVPLEDILIDQHRSSGQLEVAANYAFNAPGGQRRSLTMASCSIGNTIALPEGESRVVVTDCNTGGGSSGALVYLLENGQKKVFGVVYGEHAKKAPGSGYDYLKQDTLVVRFGSNLEQLYGDLPKADRQAYK